MPLIGDIRALEGILVHQMTFVDQEALDEAFQILEGIETKKWNLLEGAGIFTLCMEWQNYKMRIRKKTSHELI